MVGVTSLERKHHGPFGWSQKNLSSKSSLQQDSVLQGPRPVARGYFSADILPTKGGSCPQGGPESTGQGSSPELVSALAILQPEGSPAEIPAGTGGSASPLAAADGSNGQVEGTPSGVYQKEVSAEASCPTPGTETQSGLLLPVEEAGENQCSTSCLLARLQLRAISAPHLVQSLTLSLSQGSIPVPHPHPRTISFLHTPFVEG